MFQPQQQHQRIPHPFTHLTLPPPTDGMIDTIAMPANVAALQQKQHQTFIPPPTQNKYAHMHNVSGFICKFHVSFRTECKISSRKKFIIIIKIINVWKKNREKKLKNRHSEMPQVKLPGTTHNNNVKLMIACIGVLEKISIAWFYAIFGLNSIKCMSVQPIINVYYMVAKYQRHWPLVSVRDCAFLLAIEAWSVIQDSFRLHK